MAVLGRLLLGSGERLDLADILSLDSYVAADFKYLIQSFIGASKPYILYGLDVISPQDAIGTENISIRIAESVVYYPGSQAGAFYYGLEPGNINAQPLIPELRKNATNFVYLTFGSFDTAKDSRAFWDPDQSGGDGGEFSQDVNTETALKIEVNVSVSTFPENTIPICKVVVDASVITSIQDCRDHFFRLGTGGVSPDPFSSYSFRQDPSAPYARLEPPTTMTSALNPNPFQGGDKNIRTLKEWMDIVMTRIKELGGTSYWYQGSSVPGAGPNVSNVFLDALGSTIKSKGEWQHSGATPGQVTWTEDIHYYSLIDNRDLILRADTINLSTSDQVAWINLSREANFNGIAANVDWQNGISYLNGASGAFINLSKGDWVKKTADSNSLFLRVEEFCASPALIGGTATPALAQSVRLSANYTGTTGTETGQYTQGEYLLADINITSRSDASVAAAGGNFFWLAYRTDTSLGLSSAVSTTLTLDITEADGVTAKCIHVVNGLHVAHGLVDKDRVTIVGGAYAGTYIIEYESADEFYITTAVTGDDLGRSAYYAIVTTAARSTDYSYSLETANHGFKSGEQVSIAGTASSFDGSYAVNVRSATTFQIPVGAAAAYVSIGPIDGEIVNLPRLNVRTEFGTVKVVQGEDVSIGDMDSANILSFVGMDSLAQTYPNYSVPGGYNALNGHQNYNSLPTDSLTTRVSRLTAMMADRVQDRGMQIIGRTNLVNVTNGANQEVSALANLTLKKPGSPDLTITMTSPIVIPANSIAVINIDRDGSGSIVPTVESWGNNYVIAENKIILFYRFADTNVYTWDNSQIAASGHLNLQYPEDSQNRNVYTFNPGQIKFDIGTGLLDLAVNEAVEVSRVVVKAASATPQSSYFIMYSANDAEKYVVWYNKDTLGTQPVVSGTTVYIEVAITTGDTATAVATATINAINGAASVETTAGNFNPTTVVLTNDVVGSATNTADGAVATTYTFTTTQSGFDPNIEIIIPGSINRNIVDVDAINDLGTLILADGQCAWVRINRFALKTFNTISLINTPDTNGAGAIYISTIANVPIDQDVFVLWTRVGDVIVETNKSQKPDGNIYDETYDVVAGLPGLGEIQGPIVALTEISIPLDSRDGNQLQEYIVGSGQLEVFLNGQYLIEGKDWLVVGDAGALSNRIKLDQDLEVDDRITFRIDAHGAVYFASDSSGSGSLQDSYDAGRFIAVSGGAPIVITGPAAQKLLSIQGDLEVTGVIDPAGITFSQELADPLGASDYGFWRNATDQLLFKRGANPAFNFDTDFLRRDGSISASADFNFNSFKGINLAAPINPNDVAHKAYVDSVVDGRSWKQSVRVASTADIDLSVAADPSPVDGVTLANGNRILLKNQTAPAENGIYVAVDADDPTTWVRASDANTGLELEGAAVFVQEGTANADFQFAQNADSITLGTTAIVWVVTSANSFSGHDMIALSGGQISVDLTSDAGLESSNPGNAAGQLRVKLDGSTLARSASGVKVADDGITGTQLNASVAGDGLAGGSGAALSVVHSPKSMVIAVAGESMAADTSFLVRWAIDGETAGRVYKATNDASTTHRFYAWGITRIGSSAISAGQNIEVTYGGAHQLAASDTLFSSADVGKPLYLTTGGAYSITPPTATDTAVWRIGIISSTSYIWVGDKQLNGIN